jgi:hypothetical protein
MGAKGGPERLKEFEERMARFRKMAQSAKAN